MTTSSMRIIPRDASFDVRSFPGCAAAAPDGRTVVAMYWVNSKPLRTVSIEVFDLVRWRSHPFMVSGVASAWEPIVFAPSGDAFACSGEIRVVVVPWGLSVEQDPAGEAIALGRTLCDMKAWKDALSVLDLALEQSSSRPYCRKELNDLREIAKYAQRAAAPPEPVKPLAPPSPPKGQANADDELDVGVPVEHARFGRGEVVDVDGQGATARVTVTFDGKERVLPRSSLKVCK
jgi:hypothetical protein